MLINMLKGKIHRATVTDANLAYKGSITIDEELMKAAGLNPYELVHINSIANAAHWETYVVPGTKGQICLNGCPARLFQPGDQVIINCFAMIDSRELELAPWEPNIVHVDENNAIRPEGVLERAARQLLDLGKNK